MPRFQRNSLRPINSIKHVIDNQGGLIAGTQALVSLADGVDSYTLADADGVPTGARINSIFLNIQVAATATGALANVYMFVYKNPGTNLTAFPNGNVIGISDFKKFIFHQEMIMTEKNTTAIPRTLFKGVLKLPKHMRRWGADDQLVVALFSPGVTYDYCVQCIYKHYT